ncbi:membrane protein of unknown function [Candidatus Filomicrobium marinum]|uniref:Uncharacterized protein n=2 Tax=Filomicrobium TaxID=119044 RepID=A0A0D6JI58_9HYPH|nr:MULTISPECIES: hypothetical protein [Filomicrobium]MCV0369266.1 hypothetical protein [Filomicrobium sp.]CFX38660.1 membrane protein of unknown function [Candidatus Filomicrobium marinum]CPR21489.1 membrane protein of unknown function [Candidatus Filomicrobium marinum]SDP29270.1 hypothetical protein SAMN04488061_2743 [Filomicrobium insigne]
MLGYLVLVILQIIAAWFGMPKVMSYIPSNLGSLATAAIEAAIYALIVWIIGVLFSFVLKDVRMPGTPTLATALVGALIGAAIVVFLPAFGVSIPRAINPQFIPLAGAILGYLARR